MQSPRCESNGRVYFFSFGRRCGAINVYFYYFYAVAPTIIIRVARRSGIMRLRKLLFKKKFKTCVYVNKHFGISQKIFSVNNNAYAK